MIKLKRGIWDSVGKILDWLIAADSGQLYSATDTENIYGSVTGAGFSTSNVNSVFYLNNESSPSNKSFFAAGNDGKLAKSINGGSWSTINTGTSSNISVIRYDGKGSNIPAEIWVSVTSNFGSTDINSIAYNNGLWLAGGGSGVSRTSTDGLTWTTRSSTFGSGVFSIAYGNGLWVIVGQFGRTSSSTDAITWTTQTSNFGSSNINSVFYANGLFVAGSNGGQIRTSTDAITWTTRTSNLGVTIRSIFYGNGLWVAGGNSGQICTSTDTITWTTQALNSFMLVYSVAYGNSKWLTAGASGGMFYSPISVSDFRSYFIGGV